LVPAAPQACTDSSSEKALREGGDEGDLDERADDRFDGG
jgi:hypothetical protein